MPDIAEETVWDLLILGGGPAGYTAGLYAARAGLHCAVIERLAPGGQMANTARIENYPGTEVPVDGITLAQRMQHAAEALGCPTIYADITRCSLAGSIKALHSKDSSFCSRTVILAMGADPRKLGLPREEALTGHGVSYCAECDGALYRGRDVIVVGGGNSAVSEALHLSGLCRHVTLVHRRETLRANRSEQESLRRAENVTLRLNTTVTALLGDDILTGVQVSGPGGAEENLPCDGLFVAAGRIPATAILQEEPALDGGYLAAGEDCHTTLPGVYAAGDVRTKPVRQIVTAAADGAIAALAAAEYLRA